MQIDGSHDLVKIFPMRESSIVSLGVPTYDIDGAADAGDPDKFGHGEPYFSAFGDNLFFLLRRALKSDVGGFSF